MKKLFFPLLFFAANLSAQAVHTYKGPEAWRDEDLSVPHRFVKVTLLEAVNVVQHKAPFLLSNNNIRKPVFLEKDRPVYVSLPNVIPIVRDTKIRVDTVDIFSVRIDTVYLPGKTKIVYRDISIEGKRDTVYLWKPVESIRQVNNPIWIWATCFSLAAMLAFAIILMPHWPKDK